MISIISREAFAPSSICEINASKDGRYGWFLLTWHPEQNHFLEELIAEIKLEIINSRIASVSRMEVQVWLSTFTADLHWKLHALLRKSDLQEKGISLFLGVLYDHELFFVQAGRIFAVLADAKGIRNVGKDWKNYQVQSQEGLGLMGYADQDLKLKTQRVHITEKQKLIIMSGDMARKALPRVQDTATISTFIESFGSEPHPLWLILEGGQKLIKPRRKRLSRLQISSIILITLAILASLYMVFGNRVLDQMLHKARLSVQKEKTIRLEQIPAILETSNENLRKYMDHIVNLPARNISMEVSWSTDLPYDVSLSPVFSLDKIFLGSDKQLNAYAKKNRKLLWSKEFPARIVSIMMGQNSLLISLENQQLIALHEDGEMLWQQNMPTHILVAERFGSCEISSKDDPRLDRSIVVIPSQRVISVIDPGRGETISSLTLKQDLEALSTYDNFDNCFYAVVDGAILRVDLRIIN